MFSLRVHIEECNNSHETFADIDGVIGYLVGCAIEVTPDDVSWSVTWVSPIRLTSVSSIVHDLSYYFDHFAFIELVVEVFSRGFESFSFDETYFHWFIFR